MRRSITTTIAALALAVTAACAGNDVTSPTTSIVGSYSLRTVNGAPLPFSFGNGVSLTSDQLTMRADGSYSEISYFSDGSSQSAQGYYTNSNGAITFDEQTGTGTYSYQGSLSGRVLTEITNGLTVTYQKN